VRSRGRARAARALLHVAIVIAAAAWPGCGLSDHGLAWSVRRGQVGEFAIRDDEVFTIGDRLTAYETTTGRRRRSTMLPADLGDVTRGQLGPGAMVAGDLIVFGWYEFATETGTVFCFDTTTLEPRWQWRIHWRWRQRTLRPTVAVVAAGEHVYAAAIGKDGDNVFAFRLTDGRLRWSRSVETFPAESALAVAGDRLIVRSQLWARTRDWHEQLDAIALADGRRLWRTWLVGEAKYHTGGPLIDGGYLYTTTRANPHGGHLYVIRLSDGHTLRDNIATAGAPFAKRGDAIYVGGAPALAWDARARRIIWRASGDDATPPMIADGAIDDEQNLIFTGDSRHFVYVRAAATGILRDRIRVDTYPRFELFSPLKALYGSYGVRRLQVHRGMVFVGSVDGSLFVFKLD
jgi:outer membrane protein assembly factor BamB